MVFNGIFNGFLMVRNLVLYVPWGCRHVLVGCNYIPYSNDWGPSEFLYREPKRAAKLSGCAPSDTGCAPSDTI